MVTTSISIDEDTKALLEELRCDSHQSWDDFFLDVHRILPTPEKAQTQLEDSMVEWRDTLVETGGVIHFFNQNVEGSKQHFSVYYPTMEDAVETYEMGQEQVPREPDKIIVGGHEEGRVEVEGNGLTMHLTDDVFSVGFDLPGVFGGNDSNGEPYEYEGEPVYIVNNGEVVQRGVIEDVFHEDFHTTLDLGHNYDVTEPNHPDEEVRQQYEERHGDEQPGA